MRATSQDKELNDAQIISKYLREHVFRRIFCGLILPGVLRKNRHYAVKTKDLASPAGFFVFVGFEIGLVVKTLGNGLPEPIAAVGAVILPSTGFQPVRTHFLA